MSVRRRSGRMCAGFAPENPLPENTRGVLNRLGENNSEHQHQECHRALVVDDGAASVEALTEILESGGHEAIQARTLEQALVLLAKSVFFATVPKIVFTDLLLPGPPLSEFSAKVRALPSPHPWLVGLGDPSAQPAAEDSLDAWLPKSITAEAVRGILGKVEERMREYASNRSASKRSPDGRPLPPDPPLIAVVDPDVLNNLRKTTSTISRHHLYQMCVEDARGRISAMHELVALDEPDRVRRLAHEMKDSAAMVGAAQLYALSDSIETGSYNKDAMPYRLNEMEAACTRIRRMLAAGFLDD